MQRGGSKPVLVQVLNYAENLFIPRSSVRKMVEDFSNWENLAHYLVVYISFISFIFT